MKTVDTREYISMLRELTEEGKEVSILISGSSMSPFLIHHRDTAFFRKPDRPLRTGDIVFFQRDDGRYILHRICRIRKDGYYIIGDNQTEIEGPVRRDQIFAVVTKILRKGKIIAPGSLTWWFFAKVWIHVIPLRRGIVKIYGLIKN